MIKCEKCQEEYAEDKEHICKPKSSGVIDDKKQLEGLVTDMPQVVDDAVQASENKEKEAQQIQQKTVDNKNRPFDSAIHQTDKEGNPVKTPGGRFKKKLNIPKGASENASPTGQDQPIDEYKQAGHEWATMFIMMFTFVVQEEAQPQSKEEFNSLSQAYEMIFRKYGIVKMGAEMALLSVHFGYIASRAKKPKTEAFLKNILTGTKKFVSGWWGKISGKKPKEEDKND